jgi:alkylation response protein AidB-like acyl-CoA dehydrogenase
MDFKYSKEEAEFNKHVENFFFEKLKPKLPNWRKQDTTPREMFKLLGEAELLGFRYKSGDVKPIPWLENIHFYKTAAQVSGGVAIASFVQAHLGIPAIYFFGNEQQKSDYLKAGARGDNIIAFANTEPDAGSDAAGIKLKAEDKGNHYLVNGMKSYITNGDFADNIVFTAITHPKESKKHRRISMLMVNGEAPGLKRFRLKKLPWKMSHLSALRFKDVKIPKENIVGELQRGFYQTMDVFNNSRIGISALSFGTALGAFKAALKHAQSRKTFGKFLIEHQSKKNEFAEELARLEACWLLIQKAAFLCDTHQEFRYNSSMAKLVSTKEALDISLWATELLGARGVLSSHPISEYPLDAKGGMVGEGAPEVQKKIIAEHIEEILNNF